MVVHSVVWQEAAAVHASWMLVFGDFPGQFDSESLISGAIRHQSQEIWLDLRVKYTLILRIQYLNRLYFEYLFCTVVSFNNKWFLFPCCRAGIVHGYAICV